jgi:tetratricopeptide (TPR) repeat protein
MKSGNRWALMVALALGMSAGLCAPSLAQKGEVAATSAKIAELGRAGKYAEAIPLAQGQLESLEKKYGPINSDVAGALNNLALLYGDQGRDAEAEPLYKRAIAIQEKVRGLDSSEVAPELNNLAALYQRQERLPRPSRCSSARWRSARSRLAAIIPTSDNPSTIWRRCTRSRIVMPTPSRCSGARLSSTKRRPARSILRSRRC